VHVYIVPEVASVTKIDFATCILTWKTELPMVTVVKLSCMFQCFMFQCYTVVETLSIP